MHIAPNTKVYIGITSQQPEKRWKNGEGYKRHPYFYNAIKEFGWENFEHKILFTGLTEQEAIKKEKALIKQYKANQHDFGYNLTNGGEGTKGHKISEKTKKLLRLAHLGKKASLETKLKLSKAHKGKPGKKKTLQQRKKLSKAKIKYYKNLKLNQEKYTEFCKSQARYGNKNGMFGRHHSLETIQKLKNKIITKETRSKMSKAKKGKGLFGENNNAKPVVQLDLQYNLIARYSSLKEALLITGFNYDSLRECTNHHSKTSHGYIWLKETEYYEKYRK